MEKVDNSPVAVSWPEVQMLASVVGVREAARRLGLSEDRVRQRSSREGWLKTPEAKRANELAQAQRSSITVARHQLSPAALVNAEITSLGQKTRLSLGRAVAKAGEHLETLDGASVVADAGNVKSIAQTADLIHGWKDAAPQVKIRLDVLNAAPGETIPVIEAESSVVTDWGTEDCDLDSY